MLRVTGITGRVIPPVTAAAATYGLLSIPPMGPLPVHAAVLAIPVGLIVAAMTVALLSRMNALSFSLMVLLAWLGSFLGLWSAPLTLYVGALTFPTILTVVGGFIIARPSRLEAIVATAFLVPLLLLSLLGVGSTSSEAAMGSILLAGVTAASLCVVGIAAHRSPPALT